MHFVEFMARQTKRLLRLSDESLLVCMIRPKYDAALQHLYHRRGLLRVIGGQESIRLHPRHRLIPDDYEPGVFRCLKKAVKPGNVILDVGANIGLTAVVMAKWAGPAGYVHAFEPSPTCREVLKYHLQLNGLTNVSIEGSAVSNFEGTTTFYYSGTSGTNSLSSAQINGAAEQVKVPVTTIDAYCRSHNVNPSLLKIDVEGFEFHVLEGAKDTLRRSRPTVLVEMHPTTWAGIGVSPDPVLKMFAELGYQARGIEAQVDIKTEWSRRASPNGHVVFEPASD